MTKEDLAREISRRGNCPVVTARALMDILTNAIANAFEDGEESISIRGLGTFRLRERKAFSTLNPATGKRMEVPARKVVAFKQSRELASRINSIDRE